MPTTSLRIITIVVVTIALLSALCVSALAWCLIMGIHSDPILFTAFCSITTGLTGCLSGLLINTRSGSVEPTPTTIVNPPNQPVPTVETHGTPQP